MRKAAFAIALWALCFGPAVAAPAVVSTGSGAAACSANIALGAAPVTGYVVGAALMGSTALSAQSIKDSNAVALGNAISNTYIYTASYTVTGSPTATYTYAATGTCAYEAEISMSGAQYGSSSSGTTTSSVTAAAGDVLLCAVKGTATVGNIAAAISGAGTVTALGTATTTLAAGYATATGGVAACTASGTGAATTYSNIQDFTAYVAPTKGCPPYPFSCVFRPS
jgi:hypothetical protein